MKSARRYFNEGLKINCRERKMTLTYKEAIDGNIIDDAQAVENLEMGFPILDFLKPKQNFILTMILEQYNSKIKIQLFDYIAKSVLYRYHIVTYTIYTILCLMGACKDFWRFSCKNELMSCFPFERIIINGREHYSIYSCLNDV